MSLCMQGLSVLYVFPTESDCSKSVQGRLNPLIKDVDFYRQATRETDNVRMKRIFGGTVLYTSAQRRTAFKSYAAQVLIVDELDECRSLKYADDQSQANNIDYAEDRLASAKQRTGFDPIKIFISNPTVKSRGISKRYEESDKKQWMIRCAACGDQQPLDWHCNVVEPDGSGGHKLIDREWTPNAGRDIQLYCRSCRAPINRFAAGEWVAEHPDNPVSGYHITQLFTAQASIADLWQKFQKAQDNPGLVEVFYRSYMGLPYSGEGDNVSDDILAGCCDPNYIMPAAAEGTVAGIDVGSLLQIHISTLENGKRRKVFIGAVPPDNDWAEVDRLFEIYDVCRAVVDLRPEMAMARKLRDRHPGVVYVCEYPPNPSSKELDIDHEDHGVKIDKHLCLDESYAQYAKKRVILSADYLNVDHGEFVRQMQAPVRKLVIRSGVAVAVWDEEGQPDHHRHADNYEYLAARLMGFTSAPPEMICVEV